MFERKISYLYSLVNFFFRYFRCKMIFFQKNTTYRQCAKAWITREIRRKPSCVVYKAVHKKKHSLSAVRKSSDNEGNTQKASLRSVQNDTTSRKSSDNEVNTQKVPLRGVQVMP